MPAAPIAPTSSSQCDAYKSEASAIDALLDKEMWACWREQKPGAPMGPAGPCEAALGFTTGGHPSACAAQVEAYYCVWKNRDDNYRICMAAVGAYQKREAERQRELAAVQEQQKTNRNATPVVSNNASPRPSTTNRLAEGSVPASAPLPSAPAPSTPTPSFSERLQASAAEQERTRQQYEPERLRAQDELVQSVIASREPPARYRDTVASNGGSTDISLSDPFRPVADKQVTSAPLLSSETCDALITYEHGPLFDDWMRAIREYGLGEQRRNDLNRFRNELRSDTYLATHSLNDVLLGVRFVTDVVQQLVPAEGKIIDAGKMTAAGVLEAIQRGQTAADIIESLKGWTAKAAFDASATLFLEVAGEIATPLRVLRSLNDYRESNNEIGELRTFVIEQLDSLDKVFAKVTDKQHELLGTVTGFAQFEAATAKACGIDKHD